MIEEGDAELLTLIQYAFPLTPEPFSHIAGLLDMDIGSLLERLRSYRNNNVLRRIGFTFNYRAGGETSALVAFRLRDDMIQRFSEYSIRDRRIKHNYIRDHPRYNVWFTFRGDSDRGLIDSIRKISRVFGVRDYIILKSVWTSKLRVKYDFSIGLSWSRTGSCRMDPPRVEDYGLPRSIIHQLRDIPLTERPYRGIAMGLGLSEEELINRLREMEGDGVVMDYGGVLDGARVGFKHNAMVLLEGDMDLCRRIADEVPYATHVVYREPLGSGWRWNIYFMIHGRSRSLVDNIIETIVDRLGVSSYEKLYSVRSLKEGLG